MGSQLDSLTGHKIKVSFDREYVGSRKVKNKFPIKVVPKRVI